MDVRQKASLLIFKDKKATPSNLPDVAQICQEKSSLLLASLLFQHSCFFLKFRTAVAVRAAPDFPALGFRIAFAHE